MKKVFVMMLAALGMVSCSQEEFVENESVDNAQLIVAKLPGSSRITIDGFKTAWAKADKFAVFDANNVRNHNKAYYEVNTADAGKSAASFHFGGKDNGQNIVPDPNFVPKYAIYSYYSYPTFNKGKYTLTMQDFKDEGNKITPADAPMFGVFEGNTVTFKHITSILKVDLSAMTDEEFNSYGALKFKTTGFKLRGKSDLDENHNVKMIAADGDQYTPILKAYSINKVYYLPVPAGVYPNFTIFAVKAADNKSTITLGNYTNLKFTVGEMLTYTYQAKEK